MDKYEYKAKFHEIGTFKNNMYDENYQNSILKEFNEFGKDGWELVNCVALNWGTGTTGIIMSVFKRKIK